MDVYDCLRKLAKANKYQTLYSHFREGGMSFFKNTYDYTDIQIYFLNYLNFYYVIYHDIAMEYVDDIVLDNEIYEDAYVYYKRKTKLKDLAEKSQDVQDIKDNISKIQNKSQWIFKNRK